MHACSTNACAGQAPSHIRLSCHLMRVCRILPHPYIRVRFGPLARLRQKKGTACAVPFFWRRRRDSNSRAGFNPTYALSRGASSPTWVLLHTNYVGGIKSHVYMAVFCKTALLLYPILFPLSRALCEKVKESLPLPKDLFTARKKCVIIQKNEARYLSWDF